MFLLSVPFVLNSVKYLSVVSLTENQKRHSFQQFLHEKGSTRDMWKSVKNVEKPDYSDFDLCCQDTTCHSKHAFNICTSRGHRFLNFASLNDIVKVDIFHYFQNCFPLLDIQMHQIRFWIPDSGAIYE